MADTAATSTPAEPPPSYETAAQQQSLPNAVPRPRGPAPLDLPALNAMKGKRIILASASPRRRQLLAQIGLRDIEIVPSSFEENLPKSMSAVEYVSQTATEKALDVYRKEIDNSEKG